VIRITLCAFLCGLTVVVALATAAVQWGYRDRGIALDAVKRECDMLEAVNGDRCQRILAEDSRPLHFEPEPPKDGAQEKPPQGKQKIPAGERPRARASSGAPLVASGERRSTP
jgi:hypothetical protein